MAILAYDDVMLREPRLLVPGMQPLGNVRISPALGKGLSFAFLPKSLRDVSRHGAVGSNYLTTSISAPQGIAQRISTSVNFNNITWPSLAAYTPSSSGYAMLLCVRGNATPATEYVRIFTRDVADTTPANSFGFLLTPASDPNPNRVYFYNNSATTGTNIGYAASVSALSTSKFETYCLTHTNGSASIFKGGALCESVSCGLPQSSSLDIRLGCPTTAGDPYAGPCDVLFACLWNEPLSIAMAKDLSVNPFLVLDPA